jgi:predicted TIM-barrel fold metal-dependent hydrolase
MSSGEAMQIVDAHAHIFTQDMPLNDQPRHSPDYDFTVEDYLVQLDKHGIDFGVIAAASPWSDYNDYIIDSVRDNPRLRGTVIVSPGVEKYILELMKDDGIVGVRLPFIGLERKPDLTSFEYRRLLRRIRDLDWHVHLHVEGQHLRELLPQLEASGAKIVIDHLGRLNSLKGENEKAFQAMVTSINKGRTWVKASGAYRIGAGAADILLALLDSVGDDRLLWASDCPFVGEESRISYEETIQWLDDLLPDSDSRQKVFSKNAMALYGFSDD